jgi:hypothetical protein
MCAVPTRYTSEPLLRSLRYDIVSGTGDVAALSARRPKARHAARVAVAAIAARCDVARSFLPEGVERKSNPRVPRLSVGA